MRYPLIATDFDDTLLKSDYTISDYTLEVINKFEEAGGTLLISTGRMYQSICTSILRVGLKKQGIVIAYQGALIVDMEKDNILYNNTMTVKDAIRMTKILEKEDASIQIYIDDELYVEKITKATKIYEDICEIKAKVVNMKLSEYIEKNNSKLTKILAIIDPIRAKELYNEFPVKYGETLDFCISKPEFFEVVSKDSSKGKAVKYVCEKKGLTADNVITFGDAINDLSMLEYANLSFAVENGSTEAKKVAKQICPSNDEDGVAKTIEKYCL